MVSHRQLFARTGTTVLFAGTVLALAGCSSPMNGNYYADDVALKQQQLEGNASGMLAKRLLTGAGIIDPPPVPVDYTPRSPLAIPPSLNTLPQPDSGPQVAAAGTWPQDPDKTEPALSPGDAKTRGLRGEALADKEAERSTPQEMQAARIAGGGTSKFTKGPTDQQAALPLKSADMQSVKLNKPQENADSMIEVGPNSKRKYLVQPPEGYLQPAAGTEIPKYKKNVFQVYKPEKPQDNMQTPTDQPNYIKDESGSSSDTPSQ
ncbi:hypothetical protein [Pseudoxanthobacter sp.]|uniref:hypothetical protein n=1 Tax=Pseudoxanthobacter sp. TaxID=1925742 RepID=UPI002FE39951